MNIKDKILLLEELFKEEMKKVPRIYPVDTLQVLADAYEESGNKSKAKQIRKKIQRHYYKRIRNQYKRLDPSYIHWDSVDKERLYCRSISKRKDNHIPNNFSWIMRMHDNDMLPDKGYYYI